MKVFIINTFIIIFCLYSINCQCIPGKNCPIGQGYCEKIKKGKKVYYGKCICINDFWTLKSQDKSYPIIYCNHQRESRFKIALIELFLPSIGHFLVGKYYFMGFKLLLLLIIPFLSFVIGFIFYSKSDNSQRLESKKNDTPYENGQTNGMNENELHIANREEKGVELSTYLPVIISLISWGLFAIMHIVDIVCYSIGYYTDGYGAPLI